MANEEFDPDDAAQISAAIVKAIAEAKVDDRLELGCLLNRKVSGFGTP
jgi:hypothetical protein